MNVFDGLKAYNGKEEEEYPEIDGTGKNSKGVYMDEYLCQSYNERYYSASNYYEDAFDGDPEAEWGTD